MRPPEEPAGPLIELLGSGAGWVGSGQVRLAEQVMLEALTGAQAELAVTIFSLTRGATRIWDEVVAFAARGGRCTAIVNDFEHQPKEAREMIAELRQAARGMCNVYDCAESNGSAGIHAKLLVVDRKVAIIGSANLSARGMVRAHELGIALHGPPAALVADAIDALRRSPYVELLGLD